MNSVVIHDANQQCWLHFRSPRQIISTHRIEEVIPAINLIEETVNKDGLYAAGFIAYEAAPAFDPALAVNRKGSFPLLWFGIYNQPEWFQFPTGRKYCPDQSLTWKASLTRNAYRNAIDKVKKNIEEGDTYQVNFTYRLRSPFIGDPWKYFIELVTAQNTRYGAFLNTEEWSICSASPELFFDLDGNKLSSRPMKGTAPRGLTLHDDIKQAEWLHHSEKNRAENVMIVDMVRNDMGRIARTGSVQVNELFAMEKYPTLWQMTSTVTAETRAGLSDILRALFPPASITGAPKPRTMQIITELETDPRQIYTGSIGLISPDRKMQFNIAIRTAIIDKIKKQAEYGVGGGIVWDSTETGEFEESQTKAKILAERPPDFSLLETILWTPENGYYLLQPHLARLKDSAVYFSFSADIDAIRDKLFSLTNTFPHTAHKVRLLVAKNGCITCKSEPLPHSTDRHIRRVCLARSPVDSSNPFLYHKTTNRLVYDQALAACSGYDDVILWNEKGEVTESCIANIVVELDGELYTPQIRCGLLAGTFRACLIEQDKIRERVIRTEDLVRSSHIYLINSVRKYQEVLFDWGTQRVSR
ncbi:MAG: aminodeoxychorismate synthase component I [Deltaproteobacteria bacterium]|nr:aminodeoxychorismate synthase component I [Deltaproteobacteria bacterium]MBW2660459.1 aminodeoxychorismate synthase component I [Deltaproteobacteria bacterium]